MAKKFGVRSLLCLAILALASVAAFAGQSTKDGVIIINGGKEAVATHVQTPFHATNPNSTKLKTIYSNLGTGTSVYNPGSGWTVCGPNSGICTQWVAIPFTPKARALVTKISAAVGWFTGTKEVVISLNQDSGGKPGKAIHKWHFKNMETFGQCCNLDTVKSKTGLAVRKGKQYWVVASTDTTDADIGAAWNFTFNNAQGTYAWSTDLGTTWNTATGSLSALGVFGQ
ncbi:MAG TPA: choice-of-anchor R domain-containing protein [Terriglobales bacterium]|jgi:hypothetical protein|nr:choice-of-anchor R domain-containing protein [Terriglobales bacterium]